jgi:hypothetical protein
MCLGRLSRRAEHRQQRNDLVGALHGGIEPDSVPASD